MVAVHRLIKTIAKFSNVIGYHQPNLSTNRKVYASCLYLLGQLKGQLTRHAYVNGRTRHERALLSRISPS